MSKEKIFLSNPVELIKFAPEGSDKKEYTFNGVAYSGKKIKRHGYFTNLIIDTSNIRFKKKVPIYRDHESKLIAGFAKLSKNEDHSVSISGGKLLESSAHAAEIRDFAAEGFDWEMSVGLAPDYDIEMVKEGESVEVNGQTLKAPATIIRNARISEVSFVAVGADDRTNTEVFKQKEKEGENQMKLEETIKELELKISEMEKETEGKIMFSAEEVEEIALACGCGGSKSSSDIKAGADKVKAENAALKDEISALKKELAKYTKDKKKKDLSEAAEGKVELSEEKVEELLADEVKLAAYMEVLAAMPKAQKKIDPKFTQTVNVGDENPAPTNIDLSAKRRAEARQLVKDGKFAKFSDAIASLPDENYEV